jgi:hypothetical protein
VCPPLSASAGVPLVPDVLTVAGFPAFVSVPGFVVFSAVAFIPAVAGVSAVVVSFLLLMASLLPC